MPCPDPAGNTSAKYPYLGTNPAARWPVYDRSTSLKSTVKVLSFRTERVRERSRRTLRPAAAKRAHQARRLSRGQLLPPAAAGPSTRAHELASLRMTDSQGAATLGAVEVFLASPPQDRGILYGLATSSSKPAGTARKAGPLVRASDAPADADRQQLVQAAAVAAAAVQEERRRIAQALHDTVFADDDGDLFAGAGHCP